MKTTIEIPEPLYKKVKIEAIERRTSLKTIVLSALEEHFQPSSTKRFRTFESFQSRRKLTPSFKALLKNGGFSMGMELSKMISEERELR